MDEVRAYFSGDRIVCLRCGKPFHSLGIHLHRIHGMSDDDYREMYGLPWSRGLTGTAAHEKISKAVITRMEAGWHPPAQQQLAVEAIKKKGARFQPYRSEQCRINISNTWYQGSPYPEDIFDQLITRVSEGKTVKQVCQDPDMPGQSWFFEHCKANPEDRERLMAMLDTMPFEFQARNQMGFGPCFWSEVKRLRQQGMSDHQIANRTGVSAMTINRRRKERGIT